MTRRLQTYDAAGITVTYDPDLCIHAAECVRGLPAVFDPNEKRWIRPERATPDEVERAVARCPTGALRAVRPDGVSAVNNVAGAPPPAPQVVVRLGDLPLRRHRQSAVL